MKYIQFFSCILLLIVLSACQGSSPRDHMRQLEADYEKARKLLVKENYPKAMQVLRGCAEKGHGGCAQTLGAAYYSGRWVSFDLEEAIRWHTVAYQSGLSNDFAGVYGAISLATIMCDTRHLQGGYSKHRYWIQRAKALLQNLEASRSRMPSKTEIAFTALFKNIAYMESTITTRNCNANS